jgi:hypothetical protein
VDRRAHGVPRGLLVIYGDCLIFPTNYSVQTI